MSGGEDLIQAIRTKNREEINRLLNQDIDVFYGDMCGMTPLHWAAWLNDTETIDKLLSKNEVLTHSTNKCGKTALHYASQNGDLLNMEKLINAGCDVNFPDKDGSTSLHLAVITGTEKKIDLLLNSGALINQPNLTGNTPLHIAVKYGNAAGVIKLLAEGAYQKIKNQDNIDPRELAINQKQTEIVKIFQDSKSAKFLSPLDSLSETSEFFVNLPNDEIEKERGLDSFKSCPAASLGDSKKIDLAVEKSLVKKLAPAFKISWKYIFLIFFIIILMAFIQNLIMNRTLLPSLFKNLLKDKIKDTHPFFNTENVEDFSESSDMLPIQSGINKLLVNEEKHWKIQCLCNFGIATLIAFNWLTTR